MNRNVILVIAALFKAAFYLGQEEIVLATANGSLYGTLLVPASSEPVSVILIVAGSGPTDRNCNVGDKHTNAYKMLAEDLKKAGIATLRYDKRGIGQSDLGVAAESELRFEMYMNDVKEWIDLLARDSRFSNVIVAGHSEGSLLGMIASENNARVAGFISIAGAGRPADVIIKEQLANIHPPVRKVMYDMLDTLKKGDTIPHVPPIYYSLFRPGVQPYMISWFRYDPAIEIRKLKIPVLIVQGLTDIQVKEADALELAGALPTAQTKLISKMNHVLKNCDTLDKNIQLPVYNNPDLPLHAELVPAIVDFVNGIPVKELKSGQRGKQ